MNRKKKKRCQYICQDQSIRYEENLRTRNAPLTFNFKFEKRTISSTISKHLSSGSVVTRARYTTHEQAGHQPTAKENRPKTHSIELLLLFKHTLTHFFLGSLHILYYSFVKPEEK